MISWPTNEVQERACRELVQLRCGAAPGPDAHYLVWVQDNQIEWVVAIDGWVGKTCQLTQANRRTRPFPRQLVKLVFHYVFNVLKREYVFALVDEDNEAALRINKFLGFIEERRWAGMATSGKDLLLLGMPKARCRFLETLQ